jgi:hypothetical protein
MDDAVVKLYRDGIISADEAAPHVSSRDLLSPNPRAAAEAA